MAQAAGAPTVRPPLQARSVATRRRLLEGTVECLVELGLARTSTTEVCRRAGVSQGALFKHFPSKAALLGATVEHLFAGLFDTFRSAFDRIARQGGETDRVSEALRILWGIFREPALQAAYELYMAARTDEALRRALDPVLARHRDSIHAEARKLFPEAAVHNPGFGGAIDGLVNSLQGAALGAMARPDPEAEAQHLHFLETVARRELGAARD